MSWQLLEYLKYDLVVSLWNSVGTEVSEKPAASIVRVEELKIPFWNG